MAGYVVAAAFVVGLVASLVWSPWPGFSGAASEEATMTVTAHKSTRSLEPNSGLWKPLRANLSTESVKGKIRRAARPRRPA